MRKKRICSRANMTDQQARDQVNLSEYAADIIKQTEVDYGKKLSTTGWGKIMDYLEDMIYDTKKSLSDSERKIKIEDYIYQIYESDTGIKDVYTSSRVTCSVDLSAQNYASIVMKDPVKVSIDSNDDEIVSAIMEMNKDDLEKLYNSVIRKYYKLTQESSYQAGRKSRLWEKSTPHMSERDLIDSLVYFVQEGAIVPTKKASNIKGGTSIMRKKIFNVRASMSAKRRNTVSASRMRSVRCARTSGEVDNVAVRELVLYITNDAKLYPNVLSIIENMKRKVKRGQYDNDLAIKAWQYLADDGVRKYDKEFGSNNGSVSMLNPATRKEIAKQLRDYYKDQVFEDVEASKSVRCARTMRKRPVKASTKRRFAVKASNVPESDVDELYRIANDEVLPTTELYKIAGICDIDDDTFDYTYTGTAFGAYLTYIIHVGISSSDIDLYTFMRKDWDSLFPDIRPNNNYGNYVQINLDVMVSGDRISVDIADADVYERDTYSESYSKKFNRVFDTDAIEDHIKGIAEQAADKIQSVLSQYIPEDDEIVSSKSIRGRKRVCAAADGGVLIKTDSKEGTYYLTKSSTKQKTFWSASIGNANRFAKKDSALNKLYAVLRKLPENAFYDEDSIFDIEDESDLNNSEFAKFYLTDMSGNVVEDISTEVKRHLLSDEDFVDAALEDDFDDDIESAKSIECAALSKDNSVDPIDSEFMIDLYYSPNHSGRAGDRYFYDWSEAESYAHDALMHGLYVSIWNKNNGDILDISPDEYNDAWENGAADFDINEDIVNFKRRIVESAKSIKCDDEIEDEITEDDSDLTIDISQLELSEPYYETREDDPENPDKWVLVIGKNPERHMNYKLWYYVDSTDADLTALDLSNPDHIDIDEESTFEDYDDIQLSSDVSCCGDGRYSAGLVTM